MDLRFCTAAAALSIVMTSGWSAAQAPPTPDESSLPFDGSKAFAIPDEPSLPFDGFRAFEIPADEKPARMQKIQQLTFDRRPSSILKDWSGPEKMAAPKAPGVNTPGGAISAVPPPNTALAAPMISTTRASTVTTRSLSSGVRVMTKSAASAPAVAVDAVGPASAAPRRALAGGPIGAASPTSAPSATDPFDLMLQVLQRRVTRGDWPGVGSLLKALPEDEGKAAYKRLVEVLPAPPQPTPEAMAQGMNPNTMQYQERNVVSNADVFAIAAASPSALDKDLVRGIGSLLRVAIEGGSSIEDALDRLRKSSVEGGPAKPLLTRRDAGRLLVAAGRPVEAAEFLPALDRAEADKDREALNLLAQHFLARHAKENKATHLEEAWKATQAILAMPDADSDDSRAQKEEALRRAVETAPRIRKELGQSWLEQSFTASPKRGMEIIAAIGTDASQGIAARPHQADHRQQSLLLQKHAVEALLGAAPDRAEEWKPYLTLLARGWLKEAQFSSQFDMSSSRGPRLQRDIYGNIFYGNMGFDENGMSMQQQMNNPNMPRAVPIGKIMEARPSAKWLALVEVGVRPKLDETLARLHLKANEEDEAFPYVESLAPAHPEAAKELAREFLDVWIRNHDPNAARSNTSSYMYMFGFEQRLQGIPLTRSKQERNLVELAGWVDRLRKLPLGEIDEKLITRAFTACHSSAEVYRLEAIEKVYGPLGELKPATLSALVQQMRSNLAGVWRAPAAQQEKKTNRKKQDIQAEVLRGYQVAHSVLDRALEQHPDQWSLVLARAALMHDELNYSQETQRTSEFTPKRLQALEEFRRAAGLYAKAVPNLTEEEQSTDAFDYWLYASLGDCELGGITEEKQPDPKQPAKIREALLALPGEAGKKHMEKFASQLFARMSAVNPAVKFRYLKFGFEIVDDHEAAYEAKKVFDYYNDLVTEITLRSRIDGGDRVGSGQPFGLIVELRHTREIERESGGFGRYLQNQQNSNTYYYNYGRPLANYRDKFSEAAKNALQEHFDVLSVTFQAEDVHSRADAREYGWRTTPYAYLLLKAKGPEVDKIPPLRLDLDFLDTSGYVVVPVETPELPIDAAAKTPEPRPCEDIKVTEILDERQAKDGKLILEVKATGRGLIPDLPALVDVKSEGFKVVKTEDEGVSVVEWDKEAEEPAIRAERSWMVTLNAEDGLPSPPKTFSFAPKKAEGAEVIYQRYVDADLAKAEPVISLDSEYGKPNRAWIWWALGGIILGALLLGVLRALIFGRKAEARAARFSVPEALTPFTVLGLLRDIERNDGLATPAKRELAEDIRQLESHYFKKPNTSEPDLRGIAERWVAVTA
jgi:hypothetical protein